MKRLSSPSQFVWAEQYVPQNDVTTFFITSIYVGGPRMIYSWTRNTSKKSRDFLNCITNRILLNNITRFWSCLGLQVAGKPQPSTTLFPNSNLKKSMNLNFLLEPTLKTLKPNLITPSLWTTHCDVASQELKRKPFNYSIKHSSSDQIIVLENLPQPYHLNRTKETLDKLLDDFKKRKDWKKIPIILSLNSHIHG